MDMLLFLLILHYCLYAPYFLPVKPVSLHDPLDTRVNSEDGIPYYHMGILVCYLESRR